ncbi:hypothetical protein N7499_001265 [Penicillium canescens]|uniref:Uncharacterized protein n=1 Tax=Penicillium canescens TaxID=5083 RepID=A0AAD6N442_PENCN|nr:uncharacterized protein N7446_003596 [Penicillium canescens]KAJ6008684.1 hypothetical protein N7522_003700 [Penicillium canescens]KAJ6027805.1 hypothetical protein N7460_012622 [Penicillium canescens]KAJ6041088.1 hypothetical protein N7444_009993 [Penicillium canescens]KAJ6066559.1 hypothetical protein N7446_003596 [Penicillium canescens]KAJ6101635.1 hypothetical protein N7499_001265 [Penicillium canescens]
MPPPNVKRLILTAAVTSITITGTLYGAGIKTNQEIAETAKQRQESTFDEQMKALQGMRSNLTARKGIIEKQIRDLDARMLEKQQKSIGGDKQQSPKEQ